MGHEHLNFSEPLDSQENIDKHHAMFSRCASCNMQRRLCICDIEPDIPTKIPLHLVIHWKEAKRPTNSGLLAARCLEGSHIYFRGHPQTRDHDIDFKFADEQPLLLYPAPGAKLLTQEYLESLGQNVSLVVPDGNWNQAGRMPKRIPSMRDLPRVILPESEEPEFRLRREEAKPEGLSTLDAIARAYRILGEEKAADELLRIFKIMAMRTLWSKGAITSQEASAYLPK